MAPEQAPHRHHHVHRGQEEDFPRQSQQVQQQARDAAERPFPAQQAEAFLSHGLQGARRDRDDQQSEAQAQDVEVRHQGRDDETAAAYRDPVQEDHRHRALQHREGQRAEEQHGRQQDPSDDVPVLQEIRKLDHDRMGLPRHDPFEVAAQGLQQLALVDQLREHDHREDQQWNDGQQRVIGDRSGQQQSLVGAETLQDAPGESARTGQNMGYLRAQDAHAASMRRGPLSR